MLNVGNPGEAFRLAALPNDGVGLARIEFIIASFVRVHPLALLHPERVADAAARAEIDTLTAGYADRGEYFVERLAEGVGMIAAAFYPKDVIVRLSDFKSSEYAGLVGGRGFEPEEGNPMLGFRGAFRYAHPRYREAFALECRALRRVREQMGLANVKLMVPFCRTPAEGRRVLDLLAANGLARGVNGLEVYVMAEIPANAILVDEFAALFDGFSIGSNDLTQLVLGVDRDSELVAPEFDERNPAVLSMIGMIIDGARRGGTQGRDLRPGAERLSGDGPVPGGEGHHQHLAQSGRGGARPRGRRGRGGRPRHNGLTSNRARRFRAQHSSLCSVQAGRSFPYEIATIRSAGMPCAIR